MEFQYHKRQELLQRYVVCVYEDAAILFQYRKRSVCGPSGSEMPISIGKCWW